MGGCIGDRQTLPCQLQKWADVSKGRGTEAGRLRGEGGEKIGGNARRIALSSRQPWGAAHRTELGGRVLYPLLKCIRMALLGVHRAAVLCR